MKPLHAAAADGEMALQQGLFGLSDGIATAPASRRATSGSRRSALAVNAGPAVGLVAQVLLTAAMAAALAPSGVGLNAAGWVAGLAGGVMMSVALAHGLSRYRAERMSPADWVTLARATLAVGVASLVAASFGQPAHVTMLVSLAALALVLDAVDGRVARRTGTEGALGARFDGEVDAMLILVLSVYVARSAGAWVLAIGAARYVFLASCWRVGWMRATLPPRYWRKVVCATQGIVLTVAAADVLPPAVTTVALVVALAFLGESFGRDVWWLRSHRRRLRPRQVASDATGGRQSDPPAEPGRGRVRRGIAVTATILAVLVVWVALVAPDQPRYLTLDGFLRIPLELIVLIGLALVLPATPRRIVAVIAALLLTLVVVLKVVNYEMFMIFDRAFDPIGDAGQLGNGIETLRSSLGAGETRMIEIGAVAGVVVLIVVLTLAMLRLTRIAADNRRSTGRALAGLGAVWMLCWVVGAQLISHTPVASTLSAGLLADEIHQVQFDLHDEGVFRAVVLARGRRCARRGEQAAARRRIRSSDRLPHLGDVRGHQLAGPLEPPVRVVGRQPAALPRADLVQPFHACRRVQARRVADRR
jgi:phosphatidylglycerophosphate synthase